MKTKLLGILAASGLVCSFLIGATFWYKNSTNPVDENNNQPIRFVVPKGDNSESIGKSLVENKLIRSELAYKIYLAKSGLSRQIQAGSFNLSQDMSTSEIVTNLTKGTEDVWITVLEGLRKEEIANNLETTITQKGGNFNSTKFLELVQDKEGYLFPDTYLVPIAISEENLVSLLENTLQQKITPKMKSDISANNKTLHQILTMASIVEREAKTTQSRKVVSGILWKRINNNWPLQVDATLQYIKGYSAIEDSWWQTPYALDKELDSPYNTYKALGLPPAPISSSSIDSISAAIYPQSSEYWYYLTGNDGKMYYGSSLEEHNQNIQNHLR